MRNKNGQFLKGTHWRIEKPYWNKEWLLEEYSHKGRSSQDIANEFGCRDTNIHYFLNKHGITTRNMSEIRKVKYWGSSGCDNPMWNKKGELNPNWKGGISLERQDFYNSIEWKQACSIVWKRDNATCRRCGSKHNEDIPFHIHHIVSFSETVLRANPDNLVLLCEICNRFIHSKKNINKEFLKGGD